MVNAGAQAKRVSREPPGANQQNIFQVPIIVSMGWNDLHTPHEPAKAFFETLEALRKRFTTLERSAHLPMLEEPGLFLLTLIHEVLPLTEGRAVFPPPR